MRHSHQPFSGGLTGVLRETPGTPVGRAGVGGAVRRSERRGDSHAAALLRGEEPGTWTLIGGAIIVIATVGKALYDSRTLTAVTKGTKTY